ncbi:hypothetical protein PBAL39_14009 [Pedobacter sp. BAL39]|uniref:hypothetical protein n=1 Tax=Pedobacter sp. BAL39 TaxID=391596 RepID=UPI000155AA0C|nr:hypothetical protein [Pedobacter sp. BAL39]EDM34677.1 hypothetical protein PBAL39_14009 [Pedobacter sp. BAL39]
MRYPAKKALLYLPLLIIAVLLLSCQPKDSAKKATPQKYSIYILGKDNHEYLLETNDLSSGTLYPEKTGVPISEEQMDRDIIVKDGYYYHLNYKTAAFSKYTVQSDVLTETDSLQIKNFSIENFYWISKDTLLLTGLNYNKYNRVRYALVNVSTMKLIASGDTEIAVPDGKFSSMSIGLTERRGGQLLIAYTYHEELSPSSYTTCDTTFLSTLSYPEMRLLNTSKELRSTYPGGTNAIQSYTFHDEKKDFYFMTCPGIALGNRPDLPTAIFKIKADENKIDPDYFFNISASEIQNHAYGMWYLGNGKAIIRGERKDLYKGISDHHSTAHFEFYLLDIKKKTVLKKLDLPLDKGTRRECVLVENDVAYISVNSPKEGNDIWMYDLKNESLKKGLHLSGNTDFIMRIDKLHEDSN